MRWRGEIFPLPAIGHRVLKFLKMWYMSPAVKVCRTPSESVRAEVR